MPIPRGANRIINNTDILDDPPKVLNMDRFDKELHDAIYDYALAHWSNLAADEPADKYRGNCTTYEQFFRGTSEDTIKLSDEFEITNVNFLDMYMQLKHSQLLNDKLKIHYVSSHNSSWKFSQAMSQLMDYHGVLTRRNRLQQRVEIAAPLFGTVGALFIPKKRWVGGKEFVMPADWEYLDPRTIYYESRWDRDDDMPCFCVRSVAVGRLEDQKYKELLKKRDLEKFERGNKSFSMNPEIVSIVQQTQATYDWLSLTNDQDVEVIRLWVKDYRTEKIDIFYPTVDAGTGAISDMTPETEKAFQEADAEWENIINDGALPLEGEHHWGHLVHHLQQKDESYDMLNDIQKAFLDNHIAATKKMHKKQPPDKRDEVPMFKNNWRYIKIIGDQVVADGSSELEFPVAFFHNRINPGSFISISDLDNLINLQNDFNRIISDELVNSYSNTWMQRFFPKEFLNTEMRKEGPFTDYYVEAPELIQFIKTIEPPRNNPNNQLLMEMLIRFMEMISGGNQTVQGNIPRTRTSAAGLMGLQQQSSMRYNTTQLSLEDGWTQSAKIWLEQIKYYWQDEIFVPPISQEYQESVKILNEQIDPMASLIVERVSRDRDVREAQGQTALQLSMLAMQMGVPPNTVIKMLSTQYDGSTVSRIMSQLQAQLEEDQAAQQQMAAQQEMQLMNQMPQMQTASKGKR